MVCDYSAYRVIRTYPYKIVNKYEGGGIYISKLTVEYEDTEPYTKKPRKVREDPNSGADRLDYSIEANRLYYSRWNQEQPWYDPITEYAEAVFRGGGQGQKAVARLSQDVNTQIQRAAEKNPTVAWIVVDIKQKLAVFEKIIQPPPRLTETKLGNAIYNLLDWDRW